MYSDRVADINLPMQSGSDAHKENSSFTYSGIILEEKAKDIHDIIHALKSKKVNLVGQFSNKQAGFTKPDEGSNGMIVKIIYDCHNAETAVSRLRNYFISEKGLDVVCCNKNDRVDMSFSNSKEILIGHHSKVVKAFEHVKALLLVKAFLSLALKARTLRKCF